MRVSSSRRSGFAVATVIGLLGVRGNVAALDDFVNFESGQVRPLALSPDGTRLYAVNTPDNRLEIFTVGMRGALTSAGEVEVGLEPVAVAARTNTEVWVVNHLSDSISVIDAADPAQARIIATLAVGDEPRDIVFAGSAHSRAFITAAARGQNRPGDPQLTTPSVGRADVWVFDTTDLAATPTVISLFGTAPRALAASVDGSKVYVAVFESGNQTTGILEPLVNTTNGGLGLPPPNPPNQTGQPAPSVGLIVKYDGTKWTDEINRNWNFRVPFTLADKDVFVIDADANPPVELPGEVVRGVGTVLFNMAVNPATGQVYVSNTDARNEVRFEPNVRGHIAESRVTIISGTTPQAVHLNPHINFGKTPGAPSEINRSLAFPTDLTFSSDGQRLYVAAFGSGKVGELDANGTVRRRISVGGGPSGLALHEGLKRLYVLNRFDNTISVVSTTSRRELGQVPLRFDPSPPAVKNGRHFLYDARKSGHGDSACASCHIFGDFDGLAWDLGDPTGTVVPNPDPFVVGGPGNPFHPMKGPMTTQSLRGMNGAGSMHWRGDRNGGPADPLNEDLSFKQFNPAFVGLLGADSQLSAADMQAFTDFILTVEYPPNPIENLDRSLTAEQQAGKDFFTTVNVDASVLKCNTCHSLPLGTAGKSSIEGETQQFKVPHFRNLYQKIGMFAVPGEQVRGFGFLHDGSVDSVFDFLHAAVFNFGSDPDTNRRNVEAFVLALDTGLAPMVGQEVTATAANSGDTAVTDRINLLIARDEAGDCDLVVKGMLAGEERGAVYNGAGKFRSDRAADPLIPAAGLLAQAAVPGQERTYTCVPPGLGSRLGLDRDGDGVLDRDELDAGSDPADPADHSAPCLPLTVTRATFTGLTAPNGDERFMLTGEFSGVMPVVPHDSVRFTLSTDKGPLMNATLPGSLPAFRSRTNKVSYRNPAGVYQRITRLLLRAPEPLTVKVDLTIGKTDLANAVGATRLNIAVRIDDPDVGQAACGQVINLPCTPSATGGALTCG